MLVYALHLAEQRNRFLFELRDMPMRELKLWEAFEQFKQDQTEQKININQLYEDVDDTEAYQALRALY